MGEENADDLPPGSRFVGQGELGTALDEQHRREIMPVRPGKHGRITSEHARPGELVVRRAERLKGDAGGKLKEQGLVPRRRRWGRGATLRTKRRPRLDSTALLFLDKMASLSGAIATLWAPEPGTSSDVPDVSTVESRLSIR